MMVVVMVLVILMVLCCDNITYCLMSAWLHPDNTDKLLYCHSHSSLPYNYKICYGLSIQYQ